MELRDPSYPEYDENYQLCGYDIYSIIGYDVGLALESGIESVEQAKTLIKNNALIILANDLEKEKHWTCVVLDGESYCYFDSIGEKPKNPHLLKLIDRYMNKPLQHFNTMTCGRWVAHFIRFYCINEDAYAELFKGCKKPDKYITMVTGDIARFNRATLREHVGVLGVWDYDLTNQR